MNQRISNTIPFVLMVFWLKVYTENGSYQLSRTAV